MWAERKAALAHTMAVAEEDTAAMMAPYVEPPPVVVPLTRSQLAFAVAVSIVAKPWNLMLGYTIPNCEEPRWRRWYLATFLMSILWIGVLSWVRPVCVPYCAVSHAVPNTVSLAVPHALFHAVPLGVGAGRNGVSHWLLARHLHGCDGPHGAGCRYLYSGCAWLDCRRPRRHGGAFFCASDRAAVGHLTAVHARQNMAVSNAIGSNVFDICLGIGLPYFVKTAIVDTGSTIACVPLPCPNRTACRLTCAGRHHGCSIADTRDIEVSIAILGGTVVFVWVALAASMWRLTQRVGYALLLCYAAFIAYTLLKPDECD